jgi:hypothetical protein
MAHRVEAENRVVMQKAGGGLPPRLQLQLGPRRIAQLMQRIEETSTLVGNRVAAKRRRQQHGEYRWSTKTLVWSGLV